MKTFAEMEKSKQRNFPNKIIVHHVGGSDKYPLADTSHHTIENIRQWHLSRGFENVGYHYYITKSGKIEKGRPEKYHGAHTKNHNTTSIGVCLAGNFDATDPTEAQKKALAGLLSEIMGRWDIPYSEIYPHRKFANKTCYGNRLDDQWASMLVKPKPAKPESCEGMYDKMKEQEATIGMLVELIKQLLGFSK